MILVNERSQQHSGLKDVKYYNLVVINGDRQIIR
jgi:hypothetical protein